VFFLVAGLIAIAIYINLSVVGVGFSARWSTILAFSIGPVALIGLLDFFRNFERLYPSAQLAIARVFIVLAFGMLTLMLVVQQSVFAFYRSNLAKTTDDSQKEMLQLAFQTVNPVQLGIDVTFDIFYCIGIVFLSIAFLKLAGIYRWIGGYGLVSASLLLIFNLWTFPVPPAEQGLIDLGPWTIPFWLGLIVNERVQSRNRIRDRR
jgi:hypothetical protein